MKVGKNKKSSTLNKVLIMNTLQHKLHPWKNEVPLYRPGYYGFITDENTIILWIKIADTLVKKLFGPSSNSPNFYFW